MFKIVSLAGTKTERSWYFTTDRKDAYDTAKYLAFTHRMAMTVQMDGTPWHLWHPVYTAMPTDQTVCQYGVTK